MKRDMELVRKMLLAMEEQDSYRTKYPLTIDGYDENTILHHAWLMQNAGLIACGEIGNPKPKDIAPQASPICINWEGYEFLANARDPEAWDKARAVLNDTGRDLSQVSLTVLTSILAEIAKKAVGL